ncbi:hypothetical protein GC176_14230 [bacterium]|nr:hypothetical protein [bacterium]
MICFAFLCFLREKDRFGAEVRAPSKQRQAAKLLENSGQIIDQRRSSEPARRLQVGLLQLGKLHLFEVAERHKPSDVSVSTRQLALFRYHPR